ncbi:isochorismatase family protein [Actinoallomurus sp. NPDC050550]|uniref:isochorismatase family protein n=1 Tax=Actinoallomurus sp. NPDC050550 TaxID=3154937 RepID=UPI00340EB077
MAITTLDPNTALVVIDLQKGIAHMPSAPYSTAEVVARTVELADGFRAKGNVVVLVRASGTADRADATPGRTDEPRWSAALPEGRDAVVDELAGHPEDVVVTKRLSPQLDTHAPSPDMESGRSRGCFQAARRLSWLWSSGGEVTPYSTIAVGDHQLREL